MQKVKILGKAGDLFTKELRFECNTATEAISAIDAHYKGFKNYVCKNDYAMFFGPEDLSILNEDNVKQEITPVDADPLNNMCQKNKVLYFIPGDFDGADPTTILLVAYMVIMIVSAVLQILLAPSPATQANEDEHFEEDKGPSYILNGVRNTSKEGGRIPLVYGGPILVGSMTLSAKIDVNDIQDV